MISLKRARCRSLVSRSPSDSPCLWDRKPKFWTCLVSSLLGLQNTSRSWMHGCAGFAWRSTTTSWSSWVMHCTSFWNLDFNWLGLVWLWWTSSKSWSMSPAALRWLTGFDEQNPAPPSSHSPCAAFVLGGPRCSLGLSLALVLSDPCPSWLRSNEVMPTPLVVLDELGSLLGPCSWVESHSVCWW